jgi:hypothetical protein
MAIFQIASIDVVKTALDAVGHVHGGYQAVDLLTKAMSEVEEPDDFDREVAEAEKASGMRYEGPTGATKTLLKTLETAANESNQKQAALIELLSLALLRLSTMQASKILIGLLAVAGLKPVAAAVLIRVLLILLQSESGRAIVKNVWPQIESRLGSLWQTPDLRKKLQELGEGLGDEGSTWLKKISSAPEQAVKSVASIGDSLLDGLTGILVDPKSKESAEQDPDAFGDGVLE